MGRTLRIRAGLGLSIGWLLACGPPEASTDAGSSDAGTIQCASDIACSDGLFCNGVERCAPAAASAAANGCAPAESPPCLASQRCEEPADACETVCELELDADGDGQDAIACGGDDCDDSDPLRFPGNDEVCDAANRDEDCNPATFGFRDADLDGFADERCCNGDACGDDCDDASAAVHATAAEMCDLADNDCDGTVDEDGSGTFYPDVDEDSFGELTASTTLPVCTAPDGYASRAGDCDDSRAEANPDAAEICSGEDDDCDGDTDEEPEASASCGEGSLCVDGSCSRYVRSISAGYEFTCAVRATGQAVCWGANRDGNLGIGTREDAARPTDVIGIANAIDIDAGGGEYQGMTLVLTRRHACAVRSDGSVWCWGSNDDGQLGTDDTVDSDIRRQVDFAADAIAVSAGERHTCALRATGAVDCWGRGFLDHAAPVTGVVDAVAIACGDGHTCALRGTGEVLCWGENGDGQLGDGSMVGSSAPVPVTGIADAVAVSVGAFHSCAVRGTGEVLCWGDNGDGRLGINTTTTQSALPVSVLDIVDAADVACGEQHTCAIVGSGAVQCWGRGADGQLGDGMGRNSFRPVDVVGLADAVEPTAGSTHACATSLAGPVSCWGENRDGALGDGTDVGRPAPVMVVDLP